MGKYSEILESSWYEMTLYAESIPHLFHWDFAYLWMLEKESALRPKGWGERLQAWRYLIAALLTNELEVETESIRAPFTNFTQPFGVTEVQWVRLRRATKKIGVLSPTVFVRPLPDYTPGELKEWEALSPNSSRSSEFGHFVNLATRYFEKQAPEDSIRYRLARILEREFPHDLMANAPRGRSIAIPMLRQFVWTQEPNESTLEKIDILVKGEQFPVFIPRCDQCSCLLTREETADAITVEDQNHFQVACQNGHQNVVALSDFLIWVRNNTEVILWSRQGIITTPANGFPPEPAVQNIDVQFEWNAAQIEGEQRRRFIKLRFSGKQISKREVPSIFFKKILVPGKFESFSGIPVRWEWRDALVTANPADLGIERNRSGPKITYQKLRLKGWPDCFPYVFPSLSLIQEPEMAVGIYPDRKFVPASWKWYRVFLHGSKRGSYRMVMDSAKPILPWLSDTEEGQPRWLSVVQDTNQDFGVTYSFGSPADYPREGGRAELFVAIDFGTTNTTAYCLQPIGQGQIPDEVRSDRDGIKPSELCSAVEWLAENPALESAQTIGNFLPSSRYGSERPDPYIIPSAIWRIDDRVLIRWGPDKPIPSAEAVTGFKWDYPGRHNGLLRKGYLRELFFLTIPSILKKTALRTLNVTFHIGFAFPLAFDYRARNEMHNLLGELSSNLNTLTSFQFESYSINESWACVRAFGSPNVGETFLVADMGGGTMDVALFTVGTNQYRDMHEIGSLEFAGEVFTRALAEKKHPDVSAQESFHWELRDLIAQGKAQDKYGNDQDAQITLTKFNALAFEFLRTMIAAHRQRNPETAIHLVLVGNGWHLDDAISPDAQKLDPKAVFRNHYRYLVSRIGEHSVTLYEGEPLQSLPSSKHLVVVGALRNAFGNERRRELAEDPNLSKLPAGRGLKFKPAQKPPARIEWHQLVGESVGFVGLTQSDLQGGALNFDLSEMPPMLPEWRDYFLGAFRILDESKISYPSDSILRDQVMNSIWGNPAKVTRGPLQLVLEKHWVKWLKE